LQFRTSNFVAGRAGAYYAALEAQHVTPALIGGGHQRRAQSQAVPYCVAWRESAGQAIRRRSGRHAQADAGMLRPQQPQPVGGSQQPGRQIQIVECRAGLPGPNRLRGGAAPDHRGKVVIRW